MTPPWHPADTPDTPTTPRRHPHDTPVTPWRHPPDIRAWRVFPAGVGVPLRAFGSCLPAGLEATSAADELNAGRAKLTLAFDLPRGSYATLVVKRVTAGA